MSVLPNAAFSISLDCELDNVPGALGHLCTAIGDAGGNIGALDGFDVRGPVLRRTLVVHCRDEAHQLVVVEAVRKTPNITPLPTMPTSSITYISATTRGRLSAGDTSEASAKPAVWVICMPAPTHKNAMAAPKRITHK